MLTIRRKTPQFLFSTVSIASEAAFAASTAAMEYNWQSIFSSIAYPLFNSKTKAERG